MNSQFEQNLNHQFDQKCQFQQKNQQSIWTNLTTIKKKQKLTIDLNRNLNNQFEQKCQQSKLKKRETINPEQKYQQSTLKHLSTINFEQKN